MLIFEPLTTLESLLAIPIPDEEIFKPLIFSLLSKEFSLNRHNELLINLTNFVNSQKYRFLPDQKITNYVKK